ncbi:site-specific integrase [Paracoccus sp. ME4]|uniref:site-specific integrase n=1 Tax=Paracoccus sp. ME4 TaxID=3138066 RepID=UPI00398BB363
MKYVRQVRGKWTVRITVPKQLRGLIGKRELVATDLSSSPKERDAQAHRIIDGFLAQIETARRQHARLLGSPEEAKATTAKRHYENIIGSYARKREGMPTSADIQAECDRILDRIDRGEIEDGISSRFNLYTDLELKGRAREFDANLRSRRLAALRVDFQSGETKRVDADVEAEVARLGVDLAKGSRAWQSMAEVMMRAEIAALERTLEMDRGNFAGVAADPLLTASEPVHPAPMKKPRNGCGIALSAALEAFHRERSAGGRTLAPRTMEEHRNAARMFIEFMGGDVDIRSVTKQDVIAYKRALLETPNRYTMRFPGLSLPEAVAANMQLPQPFSTLAPQTINMKWLSHLSTILQWASNNGHIETNPAHGIRVDTGSKSHRPASRTPFTTDELKIIFGQPFFEDPKAYGLEQWALLLMLYTGVRNSSEMARMRLENIYEEQGVPVFYLADASKNERSKRLVPIHKELIQLGFLDYVAARRADGQVFLFPEWAARPDKVNDWFNVTYLVRIGLKAPDKVFYSFRHTLATALARAGVSRDVSKMISGHAPQEIAATYIHTTPITLMNECLNRVTFDLPIAALKA